jgi:uncharacterized protein YwqG
VTSSTWRVPPATPQEYGERLAALGLSRYIDSLLPLCRRSLRLVATPGTEGDLARTRLGGRPLLPESAVWPAADDRPLSFIVQIDCSETSPLLSHEPLPNDGLLSFFYDGVAQEAWGFDPEDWGHWAVLYTPSTVPVALREFPHDLDDVGRYASAPLQPKVEWTFPPGESFDVEKLGILRPWVTYSHVFGHPDGNDLVHRLLENPDPVQGDMQHECQLASNGIYCGNSRYTVDPRAQALLPQSSRWRLLLQIDSQEDIGMMWGDVGRIYYWIRDDYLREGLWESAWLVLQCG